MEMKYLHRDERGVSLIEVLAVLVITAIVMTLAISFLVSSNKQNHAQTDEVRQLYDAAYILKLITKDIRQADDITIVSSPASHTKSISLKQSGTEKVSYSYNENRQLLRAGTVLSQNIQDFNIYRTQNTVHISITLNGDTSTTKMALRTGGAL